MKIKVAYLVPVYNVNKYLDDCLSSLSKIKSPKEVIIIDDNGSENPTKIIQKYLAHPDFKCIKNKVNLGLGFARNEGAKHISSDVTHVYFVDSDDKVEPINIDAEFTRLKLNVSLVHANYFSLRKDKTFIAQDDFDFLYKNFDKKVKKIPVHVWGTFWCKDKVLSTKFLTRTFEDTPWVISTFSSQHQIDEQLCPTYFYRKRLSSIVNSVLSGKNTAMLNDVARLIESVSSFEFIDKEKRLGNLLRWFYELYYLLPKKYRIKVEVPKVKIVISVKKAKLIASFQKWSFFNIWWTEPMNKLFWKKHYFE